MRTLTFPGPRAAWPAIVALAIAGLGADSPAQPVSFRKDVAPILTRHCLGCHNTKKAEGGLNLATFAGFRKGGKSAGTDIIAPGEPDASVLIEMVGPDGAPRMPYKQPPLSAEQVATLTRWVQQGAKFDGPSETETPIASLVDPLQDLPKVEVKIPTSDPVDSLAFSPDGKQLAAGVGSSVILFDTATGKPVATLPKHAGSITALRFSPDGKTLISAGGRPGMFGSIALWDVASRKRTHDLKGHGDSILSADLSPDGKLLATGSYDRLIKLWDVQAGKEVRTLKEHTDAVYSVAFSADGKRLASGGADRTAKIWDIATGKRLQSFSDATAEVYAVAFTPDGQTLLAAGADRSIRAYSLEGTGGALARTVVAHDAAILRLIVARDGKTLYSSGEDRAVKVWALPELQPRLALPSQADWPLGLALSVRGDRLAIGRYDGSISLVDAGTGEPGLALREAPGTARSKPAESPAAAKPSLVQEATLNPPSPRSALRGSTVRVTLSGTGVGQAHAVLFDDATIEAKLITPEKPDSNRLLVDLTIAPDARAGMHRFGVRTPLGFTPQQRFFVAAYPEQAEAEPNNEPGKGKPVTLPATLSGTIERPGDVDVFRFEAKSGQQLVFDTVARSFGSGLDGTLELLDAKGAVLARAEHSDDSLDPLLVYKVMQDGVFSLRISDAEFSGSGNHFYRIQAGQLAHVDHVFPVGVAAGQTAQIQLRGDNLQGLQTVPMDVPASTAPGTLLEVPVKLPDGSVILRPHKVVVTEGTQIVEKEPDSAPNQAAEVAVPGAAAGRIDRDGDSDLYRFQAKKGQQLIVEVFGRRVGSPIDPVIEVLDAQGQPVPRAVLRPVAQTFVAFRDHGSNGRNIRLTQWDDLAIGDLLLVGRELMRLSALPRNPDDDAIFWGNGMERSGGERLGLLETTPEQHPMGQPMYKVEVHPPGTTFPPGGIPPVTLYFRNDDGGPGFADDARVTFDPPADGTYLVRVEDARGFGGERFGYQLVIRAPRPDFRVALSTENPNIPRGGSDLVTANLTRIDGFDGAVEVSIEGLPPGITATSAVIQPQSFGADLLISADESAPEFSRATWRVSARAVGESSPGNALVHEVDPGGSRGGFITVTPKPDLAVAARPGRVTIRPGERVEMTFQVERGGDFTGRVPIDVRNLPRGVRVLNIGLNGVLVTEKQTERTVFLYAEPWVEPMERPFYASARLQLLGKPMGGNGAPVIATSRESVSSPIQLIVAPRAPGEQASAAAR